MSNSSTQQDNRYLNFSLGIEYYAVPLLAVREVVPVPETTPIPNSPKHFIGIMNLRGQVISIIDTRIKMNIKTTNSSEEAVIIVQVGDVHVGLIVDTINRVFVVEQSELQGSEEIQSQVSNDFISGIYNQEQSLVAILDLAKVLDLKSISDTNETELPQAA